MTDQEKLDIATAFCAAWDRRDTDAIFSLLAPDCFFHNMPIAPLIGHDQIRPVVTGFFAMADKVEFDVMAMAVAPNGTVLVERVDRFLINDKDLALPVMGAFEIAGGKITVWRDYFDQKTLDDLLTSASVQGVI